MLRQNSIKAAGFLKLMLYPSYRTGIIIPIFINHKNISSNEDPGTVPFQ